MAKDDVDHVWDLMKKITFCMLANWDGRELRARPMSAYVRREDNCIYFLADAHHHKDEDIRRYNKVCLAFADPNDQKYVSLSGEAAVTNDRAKIKELWGTEAKAYFDSPEDPNIRLLKVTPHDAQYWDSPGTLVTYVKMAAAAMSDSRPEMGENRKVRM